MDRAPYLCPPRLPEAEIIALAETRWSCRASRLPGDGEDKPQYMFTRDPSPEAIGVVHFRRIEWPLMAEPGIYCSLELWQRARFLCGTLAFVIIVSAPEAAYFATIKDFEKDAIAYKPRQLGMDSTSAF